MPDTSNPRRCDNAAPRRRQAEGIATPSSQQRFARVPLPGPARRQAFVLIGATIAVAFAEAGAGLVIGLSTSSVAITGLGLDSAIKVVAALVLLWELGGRRDAAQERRALRLLALAFFAVAAYVAVASVEELAAAREPDTTPGGLIATAIAALALPLLIVGKRRLARRTGSVTLWSDVDKTRLYALLAWAALVSAGLNEALGWWWTDPVAGLAIAGLALREGLQDLDEARTLASDGPVRGEGRRSAP